MPPPTRPYAQMDGQVENIIPPPILWAAGRIKA